MDVQARLRAYITENLAVQAGGAEFGDDDPLLDSGIIDSMGVFQLVTFLETEFGAYVDDDEVVPENFETLNSIAALVARKQG